MGISLDVLVGVLHSPIAWYVIGITFIVILALLLGLSMWYYWNAKDIAPYLEKKKDLISKIASLEDLKRMFVDDIDKLRDSKVHAEEQIAKGKEAEEWLKSKKQEIEDTQKNLARVNSDFEEAKGHLETAKQKIADKQQELSDLEAKAVDAEGRRKQAETDITGLRGENAALEVSVPKLREEKKVLEKDIETLKADKDGLKKQCKELTERVNALNAQLAELEGKVAAKRSELEQQRALSDKLTHDVAVLQGQAKEAQRFISERDAARDNEKDKWGSLETPVIKESDMRKPFKHIPDEKVWLEELNSNLKDNGFIFDPRAIRAFHTGLKCAEQVPLVVLAGISGTGKSLLPELYSAALGVNFLSVPVQPRWDSPQDLFGFYNYMEGRYKATELARLLWQFDSYNGTASKSFVGRKGEIPLNLVLLDEMNLARVEYYFSDLLSKLETRNGLDYDDPVQRAKAEIEMECNASDKPRHLFVSPTTLFVGTMNEDESTQTLSDKVIDRANVLRFGRPKLLGTDADASRKPPNKIAFLNLYAKEERVTVDQWKMWLKPLAPEKLTADAVPKLRFLHDTVTPVVEALDKVYRSYGFRVDNAMKAYVLNYPGDYKDAVADQLEMKILPKLNGVELQADGFSEVRDAINTAIQKCETGNKDKKLQDAFDAACPENGTFFKWRGVMR